MAALEKIRKRAAILTIVIGLGLLAFIFEDGARAVGSFFTDTSAAKVDGEKIDGAEFNKRYQEITQNEQQNGQQNRQDAAIESQSVLGQMVMEKILDNEYDRTGIACSSNELSLLMNNSQQAVQMTQAVAQQLGQNIQSPSQLDRLVQADPQKFQLVAGPWNEMKKGLTQQWLFTKLGSAVSYSIQPNDLDILAMKEDAASYTVDYAKLDYSTLDDSKFKPTESEIQKVYDEYKGLWQSPDVRARIHYVAVDIVPSDGDVKQGKALLAKAYAALQGANGVDSVRNISEFSTIKTDKLTAAQAKQAGQQMGDSALSRFITSGTVGQTYQWNQGYNYQLFKLTKVEQLTDTAKVVIVAVQGAKAQQDKVLAALNAGQDASKMKGVEVQPEQPLELQSPQLNLDDSTKAKIENAGIGKYVVLQSDPKQGAAFIKVNSKTTATFYSVASVSYAIEASTATSNSAQDKIENFVNKNKTAEAFEKNAQKYGFMLKEALVTPNQAQLQSPLTGQGIDNSRKAIKWALKDGKEGQVSEVFTDNHDVLLAAALDKVYKDEYMPLSDPDVKRFCTNKAIAQKKAAAMLKKYDGKAKDVAGYAKLFNSAVTKATVMFGNDMMQGVNTMPLNLNDGTEGDGGIIGVVAGAKPGVCKVWAGNSAIYALTVAGKPAPSQMNLKKEDLQRQWSMQHGVNQQQIMNIVFYSAKVQNNSTNLQ